MEDVGREDREYWSLKYDEVPECEIHEIELRWAEDAEDYECPECVADWSTYRYG